MRRWVGLGRVVRHVLVRAPFHGSPSYFIWTKCDFQCLWGFSVSRCIWLFLGALFLGGGFRAIVWAVNIFRRGDINRPWFNHFAPPSSPELLPSVAATTTALIGDSRFVGGAFSRVVFSWCWWRWRFSGYLKILLVLF